MSQYNIFQALYMSFYSKDLYRDVGRNWGGGAFLYLLVLVTLVWMISAISILVPLSQFDQAPIDAMVAQIPVMEVKDGVLTTPKQHPYVIENEVLKKKAKFKLIIDTSGKYTSLNTTDADILVTSNLAMVRTKPNEVRIYNFSKDLNEKINPVEWKKILIKALYVITVPVLFFIIMGAFCYHILKSLIYAIIGKIFNSTLSYGTILQITLVAITPALVLSLALELLNKRFPMAWFVYFVISIFYMFFGISANKN